MFIADISPPRNTAAVVMGTLHFLETWQVKATYSYFLIMNPKKRLTFDNHFYELLIFSIADAGLIIMLDITFRGLLFGHISIYFHVGVSTYCQNRLLWDTAAPS